MKAGFLLFPCALLIGAVAGLAQTTTRVSVALGPVEANQNSYSPSMSADGRYVAFLSYASNLVSGDTNGFDDVFVHDRITGITERVSVNSVGVEGNESNIRNFNAPSISADGRFVAFLSNASNLVPGDINGAHDIFVHDRNSGATTRVSVDSLGAQGNSTSDFPSISADGRYVAFDSFASNLVASDTNFLHDIFVHDRVSGATERVSVDSFGVQGNGNSGFVFAPSISADGSFVAFASDASNLVPGDTNFTRDTFVRDRTTGTTTRVSVDSGGVQANGTSFGRISISADGRFIAFECNASNLVPGDTNGVADGFVHDRMSGATERITVDSAGVQANSETPFLGYDSYSISADGRFVAFTNLSAILVPGDTNSVHDTFVHDRVTGDTTRTSVNTAGVEGDGISGRPAISADGRIMAFSSDATNLVSGDTNAFGDVFVRELRDPSICRAGRVNAGMGPIANVFLVNGSAGDANRVVSAPVASTITFDMSAAPAGPGGAGNPVARYLLWAWRGYPSNPFDLTAGSQTVGCTVNPSPARPMAAPQPFRCLRGTGLPPSPFACGAVPTINGPARAPWRRSLIFGAPTVLTFQGIIKDLGASNTFAFSVTNAVILRVQ